MDNSGPNINIPENNGSIVHSIQRDSPSSDLGPLKDNERLDINCAVKEYLLLAGYRLTAMTFYEEVPSSKTLVWYFSSSDWCYVRFWLLLYSLLGNMLMYYWLSRATLLGDFLLPLSIIFFFSNN